MSQIHPSLSVNSWQVGIPPVENRDLWRDTPHSPGSEDSFSLAGEPSPKSYGMDAEPSPEGQDQSAMAIPFVSADQDDVGMDADLSSEGQQGMDESPSPQSQYSYGMDSAPLPECLDDFGIVPLPIPGVQDQPTEPAPQQVDLDPGMEALPLPGAAKFGVPDVPQPDFRMDFSKATELEEQPGDSSAAPGESYAGQWNASNLQLQSGNGGSVRHLPASPRFMKGRELLT
jgi:hypothetical protein